MRRVITFFLLMLLLADLGASLRHDLALYSWRRGGELLHQKEYAGALVLLRRAGRSEPDSRPIAYDTGVALYRLGELHKARESFTAASQTTDPGLRAAALYNLGNCAFRLGEKAAAQGEKAGDGKGTESGRQAAERLFQDAARHYEQVLSFTPGAVDARQNLVVVHSRQALLARAAGSAAPVADPGKRDGKEPAAFEPSGKGPGRSGKKGEGAPGGGEASPWRGEGGKEKEGRSPGDRPVAAAGKARPGLTRDASERLLNKARGRYKWFPALSAQGERGRQARPEKDW